ncbi:A24 family peptidase [Brevibacterium salitolerans]|uniref:A24 family peptidase n=1 Tax=Brevibacterium salitolerans TaxID=1403566 RepID=UPI003CD091E1
MLLALALGAAAGATPFLVWIDVRLRRLPDRIVLPLAALLTVCLALAGAWSGFLTGLAGATALLVLSVIGGRGLAIGLGDVKLFYCLGCVTGLVSPLTAVGGVRPRQPHRAGRGLHPHAGASAAAELPVRTRPPPAPGHVGRAPVRLRVPRARLSAGGPPAPVSPARPRPPVRFALRYHLWICCVGLLQASPMVRRSSESSRASPPMSPSPASRSRPLWPAAGWATAAARG